MGSETVDAVIRTTPQVGHALCLAPPVRVPVVLHATSNVMVTIMSLQKPNPLGDLAAKRATERAEVEETIHDFEADEAEAVRSRVSSSSAQRVN